MQPAFQGAELAFGSPCPRRRSVYLLLCDGPVGPRSLYTRFVIGEETLSSTSALSRRHSAARSATTKSFI